MARPRSSEKRNSILAAAIRVIIAHDLNGSTALIAKEANVSNGTLFLYFKTKADLHNLLYLELKDEMVAVLGRDLSTDKPAQEQLFTMYNNWINWAIVSPDSKKVLALLAASEDLTPETRAAAASKMSPFLTIVELCRQDSPSRDVPLPFIGSIMHAVMDSTTDFVAHDSSNKSLYIKAGFDALWRVIS